MIKKKGTPFAKGAALLSCFWHPPKTIQSSLPKTFKKKE